MGIQSWRTQGRQPTTSPEPDAAGAPDGSRVAARGTAAAAPDTPPIATLDWPELETAVSRCRNCGLCDGRTQTVFGVGNPDADWMIVGEAPGAEEDRQGKPFVGRAGKLLDKMLQAIGLRRADVFVANILKCRPPGNRDPKPDEMAACRAYLERQLELVRPRVLLAVGRISAQNLLGTDTPVGRLRGKVHHYPGSTLPLVVTYHPAYLLRKPTEKRKAWEDLRLAASALEHGVDALSPHE
jgi:DNA polymerase